LIKPKTEHQVAMVPSRRHYRKNCHWHQDGTAISKVCYRQ